MAANLTASTDDQTAYYYWRRYQICGNFQLWPKAFAGQEGALEFEVSRDECGVRPKGAPDGRLSRYSGSTGKMRTATFCILWAALAMVSLSYEQVSAATLTVHTNVPAVKVHVPPPKVQVHNLTVKGTNSQSFKTTSAHQFDKNNGDKGKGGKTKAGGLFLQLDGVEGESKDSHKTPGIEIQ